MTTQETVKKNPATPEIVDTFAEEPAKKDWGQDLQSRASVIGELFSFFWKVRLWWMIPMIVVLLLFFFVFVFGASTPLAPFIYSLR
jgi:hypothetical protein